MFLTFKLPKSIASVAIGFSLAAAAIAQDATTAPPTRITLQEAQDRAAATNSKAAELAELGVKAARYHRLAAQADYFPKIGSVFANTHFNKFMGDEIQLLFRTRAVPLLNKDSTLVAATVTQPITPLFKVRQGVKIARADERIAQAKAAAAVAKIASDVQLAYFKLLIGQRKHSAATLKAKVIEQQMQLASASGTSAAVAPRYEKPWIEAKQAVLTTQVQASELAEALNAMLGLPGDTQLELVPPPPLIENISAEQDAQRVIAANPAVVEAEQGVEKAKAAHRLAKLEYVPDIAVVWSYTHQNLVPLLPNDFSFLMTTATWNVFDFGKRERIVSERRTQVRMAELNLDIVKAKAAAGVKKTYLELERTRRLYQLTRKVASMYEMNSTSGTDLEIDSARAQAEAEMFEADLDYRLAHAQLIRALEER